jgi:hypothetical protein
VIIKFDSNIDLESQANAIYYACFDKVIAQDLSVGSMISSVVVLIYSSSSYSYSSTSRI